MSWNHVPEVNGTDGGKDKVRHEVIGFDASLGISMNLSISNEDLNISTVRFVICGAYEAQTCLQFAPTRAFNEQSVNEYVAQKQTTDSRR